MYHEGSDNELARTVAVSLLPLLHVCHDGNDNELARTVAVSMALRPASLALRPASLALRPSFVLALLGAD